jgi:2'-hydroxyisoflavone reductase
VRASTDVLDSRCEHYVFVSSVSVYRDFSLPVNEESQVAELADPASEDTHEHYGPLKVLCERIVEGAFRDRALIARAGTIVGPHDPTGRFTYWPMRIAGGGEVLVPGDPGRRLQFIDVRDLGSWLVRGAERGLAGCFNATGPEPRPSMQQLAEACRTASGSDASFTYVDSGFLTERGVGPWLELPLWVLDTPQWRHYLDVGVSRAVGEGLVFRPLAETVADTLEWARTGAPPDAGTGGTMIASKAGPAMGATGRVGLEPLRERQLLAEWRRRSP